MSKRSDRQRGNKAWIKTLLKRGNQPEAAKFAAKRGLSEWLQAELNSCTPFLMLNSDLTTQLPSPTPLTPPLHPPTGGEGVSVGGDLGNGDKSTPCSINPQLEDKGYEVDKVEAKVELPVEKWVDAGDMEPEMMEALAQVGSVGGGKAEAEVPAVADVQCATVPGGLLTMDQRLSGQGPASLAARDCPAKGDFVKPEDSLIAQEAASKVPYPKEGEAWVVRELPNPSLVLIRLGDGRLASMWRKGKRWATKQAVRVRIDKETGDPIYLAV